MYPQAFEITQPILTAFVDSYISGHLIPFLHANVKYSLTSLWDFMHSDYHIVKYVNPWFAPVRDSLTPPDCKEDIK